MSGLSGFCIQLADQLEDRDLLLSSSAQRAITTSAVSNASGHPCVPTRAGAQRKVAPLCTWIALTNEPTALVSPLPAYEFQRNRSAALSHPRGQPYTVEESRIGFPFLLIICQTM